MLKNYTLKNGTSHIGLYGSAPGSATSLVLLNVFSAEPSAVLASFIITEYRVALNQSGCSVLTFL